MSSTSTSLSVFLGFATLGQWTSNARASFGFYYPPRVADLGPLEQVSAFFHAVCSNSAHLYYRYDGAAFEPYISEPLNFDAIVRGRPLHPLTVDPCANNTWYARDSQGLFAGLMQSAKDALGNQDWDEVARTPLGIPGAKPTPVVKEILIENPRDDPRFSGDPLFAT